ALGPMGRVGAVMETAVSQRAAQALVEEQEQQSNLDAFGGEAIGVASAVTFEQAVAFELAQVVAEGGHGAFLPVRDPVDPGSFLQRQGSGHRAPPAMEI